ncbi:MAG: hypothetical protein JO360_07600 [Acidobacteria bacterium]|nr:hypothetical protein [Acidobacteriota bacterium]
MERGQTAQPLSIEEYERRLEEQMSQPVATSTSETPVAPTISPDEQARLIRIKLDESQLKREAQPSTEASVMVERARLWMAVVPSWTLPLAEACRFPAGEGGVEQTLNELLKTGLIEVAESIFPEEQSPEFILYSMPDVARADVLGPFVNDKSRVRELEEVLADIGKRILDGSSVVEYIPLPTRQWATLAVHAAAPDGAPFAETMAGALHQQVSAAVERRDVVEVSDWIDTAGIFAEILAQDLDLALSLTEVFLRANRSLELLQREENDLHYLKFKLEREEQLHAFNELMDGTDDAWALHFIGTGGVGKTMLIRDIAVYRAAEARAVSARIDFDYLNPDYPSIAPGLLLWSLSQELRLRDNIGVGELFDEGDNLLRKLHQRLRGNRVTDWREAVSQSEFTEALVLYIQAFKMFARAGQRVLLILDTCEELARVRPDGSVPESIEATFAIIRALHNGPQALLDEDAPETDEGAHELRVIFAGRRLLAQEGFGWSADALTKLPPRRYLRLHEIRGFTRREAEQFLRTIMSVPEQLIAPIIKHSPDVGQVTRIKWAPGVSVQPDEPRFNPFELKSYADWAQETPPPTPEIIEKATGTQYIEIRIIRRLHSEPLAALLPIVALMGHFDKDALRALSDDDDEAFKFIYARLSQQEWISSYHLKVEGGNELRVILNVEPEMRRRLLRYFRRQGQFGDTRRRAADYFERLTLEEDLEKLDWSYFDAALSVLEDADPERAARWWRQVEARVLRERSLAWMEEITSHLLSEEGAARRVDQDSDVDSLPESSLRSAILTTYASTLLNMHDPGSKSSELSEVWGEVREKSERHPEPEIARELNLRGLAGGLAAAKLPGSLARRQVWVGELWQTIALLGDGDLEAERLASLVAAVETLVELAEQEARSDMSAAHALLQPTPSKTDETVGTSLADGVNHLVQLIAFAEEQAGRQNSEPTQNALQELRAFALSLAARVCVLAGDFTAAAELFQEAFKAAPLFESEEAQKSQPRSIWADWLPPAETAARVRLEFARLAYPKLMSPAETLELIGSPPNGYADIDGERLQSALLLLGLAEKTVTPDTNWLERWYSRDSNLSPGERELVPGPVTCNAHQDVPPLFVAVAMSLAAAGQADRALPLLRNISTNPAPFQLETVRAAERVQAYILKRMRLRDEGENVGTTLEQSGKIEDRGLFLLLNALSAQRSQKPLSEVYLRGPTPDSPAWLHFVWQSYFPADEGPEIPSASWAEDKIVSQWNWLEPLEEQDFIQVSLSLDLIETALLLDQENERKKSARLVQAWDFVEDDSSMLFWWETHGDQPEEAWRLWLRRKALGEAPPEDLSPAHPAEQEEGRATVRTLPLKLISRLGVRRAAEVALEEGELLALRFPRLAVRLLEYSRFYFVNSQDVVGETIAGLAQATALMEKDKGDKTVAALKAVLDAMAQSWSRLAASVNLRVDDELPTWTQIESLAEAPTDGALNTLSPFNWRPWLVRALVSVAFLKNRTTSIRAIAAWVRSHYGVRSGERVELPPELAVSLKGVTQNRQRSWARTIAIAVLGLLIVCIVFLLPLIAFFYIIYSLIIYPISSLSPEGNVFKRVFLQLIAGGVAVFIVISYARRLWDVFIRHKRKLFLWEKVSLVNVGLSVLSLILIPLYYFIHSQGLALVGLLLLITCIALAMVTLLWWAGETIRSYIFSGSSLAVRLLPATRPGTVQQTPTEAQPVKLQLERVAPRLSPFQWPPFYSKRLVLGEWEMLLPGLGSYQLIAESVPEELEKVFKRLHRRLIYRTAELSIQPTEELHGPAWEAIFTLSAKRPSDSLGFPFRQRRVADARLARPSQPPARAQIVSWVGTELMRETAQRGWKQLADKNQFEVIVRNATSLSDLSPEPDKVRVLHLTGRAQKTSAGTRFLLAQELSATSDKKSLESREADQHELLIRAEDLVRAFPYLSVCVLHAPPGSSDKRTEGDRRRAINARLFAAEVFAQGIPVVVVIPPLKPTMAVRAIEKLARVLGRNELHATSGLLKTLDEMRKDILGESGQDKETSTEIALDVCLYAVADWDGRLAQKTARQPEPELMLEEMSESKPSKRRFP